MYGPRSRVTCTEPPFDLQRSGWGTFEVDVTVYFLPNLGVVCHLAHDLSFDTPHPSGTAFSVTLPPLRSGDRGGAQGGGGGPQELPSVIVGRCTPDQAGWQKTTHR